MGVGKVTGDKGGGEQQRRTKRAGWTMRGVGATAVKERGGGEIVDV